MRILNLRGRFLLLSRRHPARAAFTFCHDVTQNAAAFTFCHDVAQNAASSPFVMTLFSSQLLPYLLHCN
jgi:hypothetical protein